MKDRIEKSIIPAMLETYVKALYRDTGEKSLLAMLQVLNHEFRRHFDCIKDNRLRTKLFAASDELANKILAYTRDNDFSCRKGILTMTGWLTALAQAGAISLTEGTPYWNLLQNIGDQIHSGMETEPELEKEQESTLEHILAIHDIAQSEGYFL